MLLIVRMLAEGKEPRMSEEAIQDTGSQAAPEAVAADAAPVSFLESLTSNTVMNQVCNFKDVNGMAKGYMNAERMIGADKIAIPGKSATPDEWRESLHKAWRTDRS